MAENKKELKLTHILITVLLIAVTGGVGWGVLKEKTAQQEKKIQKMEAQKVEKEIFNMHQTQQTQQFEAIGKSIDNGFERMGKRLEKIESK